MTKNTKPELLLPARDFEVLKVAYRYGADACYIGGEEFSLRAMANNFSDDDLKNAIDYAHSINKKIYVTANIYAHNRHIEDAKKYFMYLNGIKPDAVLISDIGLLKIAKEIFENVDIHISTQANTTNYEQVLFYKQFGAKRVVLARELTLKEIKEIKQYCEDIDIECFVHGAMCISYSGRCLLSAFMSNRSSNLGLCSHPCRWKYNVQNIKDIDKCENDLEADLIEEKRPDEKYKILETNEGSFIFNSKDLCMIDHIDDLVDASINSFKIEGRMKNALYVATMARTYRKAIDDFFENKNLYFKNIDLYKKEIMKCTFREYSTGFYYGFQGSTSQVYGNNTYVKGAVFYGNIDKVDGEYAYFEQKNKFNVGDTLEIIKPDFTNVLVKVLEMIDEDSNEQISSCPHSKQKLKVKFDKLVEKGDIIRNYDCKL